MLIAPPPSVGKLGFIGAVKARIQGREDSELEQSFIRIVIAGVVLAYMRHLHVPGPEVVSDELNLLLSGVGAFLIFSVLLFVAIIIWPAANVPRRVLGMIMDAGMTTFCVALSGEVGIAIFGVYLFITFGNGFRYGRDYLIACQCMCLAGFLYVLLTTSFWLAHPVSGWGLFVALIVLPLYVLTLLKRIEEARGRAEEANRAKSAFLANMSHEMRTPLNGIIGVTDLLKTTPLSSEQSELMGLLRHSVTLLRSLVDDVLDISKIEAGRLSIEIADFDLHALLNSVVKVMRPHAVAKSLVIRAMIDPAIDYRVKGDPHHLRQVLVNLISNAIKFTERGQIEVTASLLCETPDGPRVHFEVRDTGIGISEEAQKRIFERFVQADTSTTRRFGGTGLGTTIAKELVELMGGSIGLESTLGVGSAFWFDLTLHRADSTADETQPAASTIGDTGPALLVANEADTARLEPLVAAACDRVEACSPNSVVGRIQRLNEDGLSVPAVLVAGNADTACQVFERLAAQHSKTPTAMIYVASTPPTSAERQRLRGIEGASYLGADAPPRLLRNAIHAATSEQANSAEIIDLGLSLKQKRQHLRILVAEDNATNQMIISRLLENAGHQVFLARDGEEALDLFEEQIPDLAIFDFNMPVRNGLEAATAIRNMETPDKRLPIIILSASVTTEARARALQAGADEFIGKPFDAASVLQAIDRISGGIIRSHPLAPHSVPAAQLPFGPIPLIDPRRLSEVERIGAANPEFMRTIIDGFGSEVEALLKRLDVVVGNGEAIAMTDLTHTIKGAAVGIGAQKLASLCAEMDRVAANGQRERLPALSAEMRKCFAASMAQLTPARAGHRASKK